jgi:hypothetical protein
MHTRRNVEEVFNVFQEHKTLVIQDYVEACVWYQKAADAGDKKALAKLSQMKAITRLGDEVRLPAVQKFARGWKKDPSHLHLNQPLTFTLSVDFHPAPFEPTLQCARRQIMLLTKFAPPQPTGFEFPHQSLDLLAASPLPNASLSDFRHADSASKTHPAR